MCWFMGSNQVWNEISPPLVRAEYKLTAGSFLLIDRRANIVFNWSELYIVELASDAVVSACTFVLRRLLLAFVQSSQPILCILLLKKEKGKRRKKVEL